MSQPAETGKCTEESKHVGGAVQMAPSRVAAGCQGAPFWKFSEPQLANPCQNSRGPGLAVTNRPQQVTIGHQKTRADWPVQACWCSVNASKPRLQPPRLAQQASDRLWSATTKTLRFQKRVQLPLLNRLEGGGAALGLLANPLQLNGKVCIGQDRQQDTPRACPCPI